MSKIKTTKLEPRSEEGTLTIGAEPGTTQFEGTVIIPGYATKDYVQGIVSGDIAVELDAYQNRSERDKVDGYAGLDGTGRVPANRLDVDMIAAAITTLNAGVNENADKIEQLEEASTFQIEYYVDNLDGSDPGDSKMGLNAPLWADTTEIKLNHIDGNNHEHDFTSIHAGDKIWFVDADDEDDDLGMYTVLSYSVGPEVTTFVVDLDTGKGGPSIGDKVEAEVFPAVDMSAKADITYVDARDKTKVSKSGDTMTGSLFINVDGSVLLEGKHSGSKRIKLYSDGRVETSYSMHRSSASNLLTTKAYVDNHGPLMWLYKKDKDKDSLSPGEFSFQKNLPDPDSATGFDLYIAGRFNSSYWFPYHSSGYSHGIGETFWTISERDGVAVIGGKGNKWWFMQGTGKYAALSCSYLKVGDGSHKLYDNRHYYLNLPSPFPLMQMPYHEN